MCLQDGINKNGIKTVTMCLTAGQIKINIYILIVQEHQKQTFKSEKANGGDPKLISLATSSLALLLGLKMFMNCESSFCRCQKLSKLT